MMLKLALLDDYQNVALKSADWSVLNGLVEITAFHEPLNPETLTETLRPFDALCLMRERTRLSAEVISLLPNLKFICSTGRSNAALDVDAAEQAGVRVRMTGSRANGPVELTWALILSAACNLGEQTRSVRDGGWQNNVSTDLEGSVLGVVGLGRIGSRVAAVAKAFGMEVEAWSPNLTQARASAAGATYQNKEALFEKADFVTIHMSFSSTTQGLVGEAELNTMKPSAWLINTSRSQLVDQQALRVVLSTRRIAGAALDVFPEEPLPADDPFRWQQNVICTPHIGFVTKNNYQEYFTQTVEHVREWLASEQTRCSP